MGSLWPPVGSHLGHYRLVEKLDEGGVGAVYKAHEAALDRHVAVKVLSPELAKDVSFVHQFLREARAVAALNHPNIIQIYFIGQHDQYIYFAMELVQGRTLDRLLQLPQRPSERELLSMIRQAAMGLQYAQQHGVIHRDIKPSNLILNELGLVKVADFGLARKVGQSGDPSASSMSVADSLGTPEYMSPEDAANDSVDHRSDLYSLGATLYHLLAGKPLFTGKSGTEVLMHQIHTPPPSVRRVNPQVSPQTAAIIERCLAKKPEARFQTYELLIKAIDDTLAGRTPVAHIPRSSLHVPQTQPTTMQIKPRGPGPMVWVLVLLILGAAAVGIWQITEHLKSGTLPPATPGGGTLPTSTVTPSPPAARTAAPPLVARSVEPPVPPQPAVPARPILPSAWTAFDLVSAFNRNVISGRAAGGDVGLRVDGSGILLTHRALKEANQPGVGLPDSGELPVPAAEPAGDFRLHTMPGPDVLFFTGPSGPQPAPVRYRLPGHQCERYRSIAVLHAATFGAATIGMKFEYDDGSTGTGTFRVMDWFRESRSGADAQQRPVFTTATKSPHVADLFSALVPVDSNKVLKAITFSVDSVESGTADKFSAGLFAVSGLPVALVDEKDWRDATELLPKIELARDSVFGAWRRDGAALTSGAPGGQADRIQLPYELKEDFDLRVVFTVPTLSSGIVGLICDRSSDRFLWAMRGGTGAWFGVEGIQGRPFGPWRPGSYFVGQGLVPGKSYDCVLKVRGSSIRTVLNGVLVGEWSGDQPLRVDNPAWRLKSSPSLGVGAWNMPGVSFTRIAVRAVARPAPEVVPPTATAVDPAPPDNEEFPDKCLPVARMIAAMQIEGAEVEAQRLAATATASLQTKWMALQSDITKLTALKRKAANGVSDRAGRTVSWTLRNGQRIDAQLVRADAESITLRKPLPSGFAEMSCKWTEILPSSLMPLFASVLDPKDPADVQAYGLLLLYQASSQVARPEDARRALMTAAERQASLKAEVEERLKWLDAWTSRNVDPAAAPASTTSVKTERGIAVQMGTPRYNWRCMDLATACNADIIYTGSRAAADEFQTPGLGWTTAGWLQRNNIIGEFTGIPDDGRLAVTDEGEKTVFDFTMPPRRNVILLGPEGGRWPRSVRLDVDAGDASVRYDEIAILHAASGADTPLTVTLEYGDGKSDAKHLHVLDWNTATRKSDLSPGQRVAIATRSNRMTNMSRIEMISESVSIDPPRAVTSVTLTYAGDKPSVIGIFGISAHSPGKVREGREPR